MSYKHWLAKEVEFLKKNYTEGDEYNSKKLGRSIHSIKKKRKRLNLLLGKPSPLKGTKRGSPIKWTKRENEILKKWYPLLGYYKPKFHRSIIDFLPDKTQPQIRYRAEQIFKIPIERQKGTDKNRRRCIDCLKEKNIKDFGQGNYQCKECQRKIWVMKRKENWYFTYLDRYRGRLRKEGFKFKPKESQKLFDEIIQKIGLPKKCFFNDKYCLYKEFTGGHNVEFGHVKPSSEQFYLNDPNNVIWLCRRHNLMMGNRSLNQFHKMVQSTLQNYYD